MLCGGEQASSTPTCPLAVHKGRGPISNGSWRDMPWRLEGSPWREALDGTGAPLNNLDALHPLPMEGR